MSRLGKQPITVPEKTEVVKNDSIVTVKGPHGELSRTFRDDDVLITINGRTITLAPKREGNFARALWGTYASHLKNMIAGVNKPYEKKLILEGVGYKSDVNGDDLVLAIGFSHPVRVLIPKELKVKAEKNVITVSGVDKDKVGEFTANLRAMKKPEPYKGKGFRYDTEVVRRKQGKRSA